NDVDEGILLADRIIPLSMGPRATLGPEVAVDIGRPRDRKGLNHNARFKEIRKQIFDYLLGPGRKGGHAEGQGAVQRTLPQLAPQHLSAAPRPRPTRVLEMVTT